jgi:hypothetical protein
MEAHVGETLVMKSHHVGEPDRSGEIIEVRGESGHPPFLVRFEDGHEGLVFPGSDAVIQHPGAP